MGVWSMSGSNRWKYYAIGYYTALVWVFGSIDVLMYPSRSLMHDVPTFLTVALVFISLSIALSSITINEVRGIDE